MYKIIRGDRMFRKIDPKKLYIMGDPHFFDESIIRCADRPFITVGEMNHTIIENCNNTIKGKDAILLINGDLTMTNDKDLLSVLNRIKAKKWLIKGNHDDKSDDYYKNLGFEFVSNFPIVINDFFIVSHEPLFLNNKTPFINIFAHVHSNPMYKKVSTNSYCTSLEMNHYEPVSLQYIIEEIKKKGAF
ncbi:phosphoesterase [Candidatus Gracilibacteria bacterium]|nr:MAG: phosphoesterase [Candidatus Gracilibacteria bacterium]